MAIQTLNTIKNWFRTGLKPTQTQFWDTWDSFRHKSEKVPVAEIDGIDALLQNKTEIEDFENHLTDPKAHSDLFNSKAEKSQFDAHTIDSTAHEDLFNGKENKSQKGVAEGYAPLNEDGKIDSQYLNVIDNLTAGGSENLLSAEQGKVLQDHINEITTTPFKAYKNVIHFGNSICKHPILTGIWWGEWGMAATIRDNDYVHKFLSFLKLININATSDALNITAWETNYATFNKSTLDSYLVDKDLIILRLGENVTYYTDFQNQYKILIQYIQSKAPNADIILGGQFWTNATKETAMQNVAIELGLPFVSVKHLDSATYKQSIGGIVHGDDGLTHTITDSGVASHPNDLGMQKIAEALFSAISFTSETRKTTPQKEIIGNITLDNSFNGCIVKVKATATITIPSSLKPSFNCVFDVWTGFTATFVAGSGVTISSNGLKLLAEKMGTLYKDGATPIYRLKGETIV
jgi:hypothetical protein